MARKVLFDTQYTFAPATRTITIPRAIPREKIVLITNVTTNQVIYNFSDPALKATSYTITSNTNNQYVSNVSQTTTIVLNYNTAAMSATDKLQIIIDEYDEKFTPAETYVDPANKMRVSTPQSMIDTDFELSVQPSKWETLTTTNQRPYAYASIGSTVGFVGGFVGLSTISSITLPTGSRTVTVALSVGTAPANGSPVIIQDTILPIAAGVFIIESGGGTSSFTYTAKSLNNTTTTAMFDPFRTIIYPATPFYQAGIGTQSSTFIVNPGATNPGLAVTVTTGANYGTGTLIAPPPGLIHGLSLGNYIGVNGITGTVAPNGNFNVAAVLGPSTFTYFSNNGIPSGITTTNAQVFVRPQGVSLHRAFDGGVTFTNNALSNNERIVRQTRRYFRYQSGKGIQFSGGSIFRPNFNVDSMTAAGTLVTVTVKDQHNLQPAAPGVTITVFGANESAYNGTFTVNSVINSYTFTYVANSVPSSSTASGNYIVSCSGWFGAVVRQGAFDDQNGMFFEFDGQQIYCVRRNSIYQAAGRVNATFGSNLITQSDANNPTAFSRQLNPGDYIVLRGNTYRVHDILSDTQMTILPSYKGPTTTNIIISKTQDIRVPQSQWNLDKCDGTGPSGYNLDLTRMQMFYVDYTWYGAGFIRYGVRGPYGDVIYVHKVTNSNANSQAYMRSGNLPARYEVATIPPVTKTTSFISASDTVIGIGSTAGFPSNGVALIRDSRYYEYVTYTGIGTTALLGVTRAQSGAGGAPATPALTITAGSVAGSATTSGVQIGQRAIGPFPDATYVAAIGVGSITHSNAALTTLSGVACTYVPMGFPFPQNFPFSLTSPAVVELGFPSFGPSLSHWGASVMMDGRYDDDKSLLFTYGQVTTTTIPQGQTRALFSIRIAPSVDNGVPAAYAQREIVNRMQLILRTLDIAALTPSGLNSNLLARLVINGQPYNPVVGNNLQTVWTNAINNAAGIQNSSFAQIADYSQTGGNTATFGGEITGGFFIGSGANSVDLSLVRDLGNSALGGGYEPYPHRAIYPDGPDVLTVLVTNVGNVGVATVLGRLSWTEAQA